VTASDDAAMPFLIVSLTTLIQAATLREAMSYLDGLVTCTFSTSVIRSDDGSCGSGRVGCVSMAVCVVESVGSLHVQG
jgi:hypothetical protein